MWFEKYFGLYTQKRFLATNDFEKVFYILLNNAFYEKTMENVRIRIKAELIKKDDNERIIKQQSKLTFNGIQSIYTNYDSY